MEKCTGLNCSTTSNRPIHSLKKHFRRPDLLLEMEDRLRSVQAENQLLGRVVRDFQAEKEYNFQQMTEATQAQQQAEQVAVRDKQRADDLQHQLAAAQQEQQRLRSSFKAQASVLEKSRSMQDDMADVLLSLKQESEDRGNKLSAATKRFTSLKDRLKLVERHLAETQHQRSCLEEEARSAACSHQQAMKSWRGDNEHLRASLASTQQHLQEACSSHEANTAVNADAYHGLQARQQALQSSLAEQSVQSSVSQYSLEQQVQSLQLDLKAVRQERDAAVSGMKALQICEERKKCSLHVGLSQIAEVRQQLVEAHRRCSEQQATIVELHDKLLASHQQLQAKDIELAGYYSQNHKLQHCTSERSATRLVLSKDLAVESESAAEARLSRPVSYASGSDEACKQVAAAGQAMRAAREAEVSVMRSLQCELRRVHVLERMCLSDVAEINTLHHQLHASQQSAWALRECFLRASMSLTTPNTGTASLPALCLPCQ